MPDLVGRFIPSSHALVGIVLLLAGFCGVTYAYYLQYAQLSEAQAESDATLFELQALRDRLAATEYENQQLRELVQAEADENEAFSQRVEELANTVGFLDKLSKTDRELLQKYSSVYFLSDNFVPEPLIPLNDEMLGRPGSNLMIHGEVFPFLKEMMDAAKNAGAPLRVLSAYRSFGTQSALKSSYKVTYGSGANKFSADQGYSEHQLGSTVDFTTPEEPETLTTAFRTTPQFLWLVSHAHEYGFVLSYPENNDYFQFEPWHWRFVGKALATRLYYENKYFYDLDQREINPYLARIFDK